MRQRITGLLKQLILIEEKEEEKKLHWNLGYDLARKYCFVQRLSLSHSITSSYSNKKY